jgi:hypothetical protein
MRMMFGSKLKSMLARKLLERGKRETNQMEINTSERGDLFYPQRPGLFQPFPSLKRSLRSDESSP